MINDVAIAAYLAQEEGAPKAFVALGGDQWDVVPFYDLPYRSNYERAYFLSGGRLMAIAPHPMGEDIRP